jgi:hypothetical protein
MKFDQFLSMLWMGTIPFHLNTSSQQEVESNLSIPSVSASFEWTAQQVAKLGNRETLFLFLLKKN